MTVKQYYKMGIKTAFITFLLGILVVILYALTADDIFTYMGLIYISFAGIINIFVLLAILIKYFKSQKEDNKNRLLLSGLTILLNIPTAFICAWFGMYLMGVVRITFINTTKLELTNIKIEGCEPKYILRLKPNESETFWITPNRNCNISINYLMNGERINETAIYYALNSAGEKVKYKISSNSTK